MLSTGLYFNLRVLHLRNNLHLRHLANDDGDELVHPTGFEPVASAFGA